MTSFTVNGEPVHYKMDSATPLLWALRDASNLTGTRYGCGVGQCGACTVHVDSKPVRSCQMTIAQAEGAFVTTIEGLAADRGHPVQQAFVAEFVPQCGHCTPGMIMAAAALIAGSPAPGDGDIDAAITNLCRCGCYPRLHRAVRRAAAVAAGRETIAAAPPPAIDAADAARAVPALAPAAPRRAHKLSDR